jgi:hypothetical protein
MINTYQNLKRWLGVLNLSIEFKISLSTIILTLVLFTGGNGFESGNLAYGQFFETNSSNVTSNSTSLEDSNDADIVLLSQKLKKASFGYRDLIGQVKNVGNDSAESVNVHLTVYDKNGGVIGTENTYADIDTLKPGQKSTFKFYASTDDFKGMDHYELSLEWGNPDGSQGYVENAQIYKSKDNNDDGSDSTSKDTTVSSKDGFPNNLAPIPDEIESIMRQYCADSPDGNMTADLVDTGKINSIYASWNCDYLEQKQKLGEKISKSLQGITDKLNE